MDSDRGFEQWTSQISRALVLLFGLFLVGALSAAPILLQRGASGIGALVLMVALLVAFGVFTLDQSIKSGLVAETRHRKMFRAICRRVGLVIKSDDGRLIYPGLTKMVGYGSAWSGRITPLTGQTVGQWEKTTDAFSLALAASVRFSTNGDGSITIKVGTTPLETRHARVTEVADYTDAESYEWRKWLRHVPVAIGENGQTFKLPAIDTHLLVVGESGSGKGSVVWSMLVGLVPGIKAGVVRVWGLDPKRVELAIGRPFFYRYAATSADMLQMLKDAVADMESRSDGMAGIARKFTPSQQHPMNVIVIDELAYLSSMVPDAKVAKEINKLLQTLLVLGRSGGYMVVGAAQDPRKETIALRDMFPTRVGLRMKSGMVDLVLGSGARADGALCDQIPDPEHGGAGQAFVIGEGSHDPKLVRFNWVPDELIQQLSSELQQGTDGSTSP